MGFGRLGQIGRQGWALLVLVTLLCVMMIVLLANEVREDLQLLNSANTEGMQWTLSQTEVEFLEFQREVERSLAVPSRSLETLRQEFDIFYSRIGTLERAQFYSLVRQDEAFSRALRESRAFLDRAVVLMDSDDETLIAGLPGLASETDTLRLPIRDLSTAGLSYFAEQSDARRNSVAVTLFRLALVATAMMAALALVAGYSHWISRQSQRKSADLEDANLRLNTILETSLDGVIVVDLSGRILRFNAAAERIFGYSADEAMGRRLGNLIVPEHLRADHEAGMRRLRQDAEPHVIGKGRIQLDARRKSGEVFPVELALETANSGKDRIVIGFLRDVSARVAAEKELVEARDSALAGERAKADFVAVMSHEIRTPLNGILGNLTLLEDTALEPDQARYVRNMSVSGKLLQHHVDTVLDIARFEAGKMQFSEEPVDLGELASNLVDSQSAFAEAGGNRLGWAWTGPAPGLVRTDPARLQQVLLNLLGNAIKFTRNGRISLEMEPVSETGAGRTVVVEFRVIDTGVGIAEADLPLIFNDFQTSDPAFDRMTGGTGLGLGIARRLTEGLGGEIGAESTPGEGSVFWVRVPLRRVGEAEAQNGEAEAPSEPKAGAEILVIEDNDINRALAVEMLTRMGQTVSTAENGLEGVRAARAHRFDLILMDISMPVMDGVEAARRIRDGNGASAATPIVALSANVLPEAQARIRAAGMSGFLGKPVSREDLRATLIRFVPEPLVGDLDGGEVPPEVFAQLYQRFEAEADQTLDWLGEQPADLNAVAETCHKMAGSAAVFGASDLHDALLQVAEAARAGDKDPVRASVARARAVWAERAPV